MVEPLGSGELRLRNPAPDDSRLPCQLKRTDLSKDTENCLPIKVTNDFNSINFDQVINGLINNAQNPNLSQTQQTHYNNLAAPHSTKNEPLTYS